MSKKELTLAEFVAREKVELDKFEQHWIKSNKKDPENWPMTFRQGEWDEQLAAHQGYSL